jgi:hypothetical protein
LWKKQTIHQADSNLASPNLRALPSLVDVDKEYDVVSEACQPAIAAKAAIATIAPNVEIYVMLCNLQLQK